MFVRNLMIEDVTAVTPEDTLQRAYDLIQTMHYDCLPVFGSHANKDLAGVIALTDIYAVVMQHGRQAALAMSVGGVMVKDPIVADQNDTVERAAKSLMEHDIPCLPVLEDGKVIGIIHESDIFKAFSDMLGVDSGTSRLTLIVPDRKGQLARIAEIIRDAGISIRNLATFHSKVIEQYQVVVRVETDTTKPLIQLLEQHGYKVIHVD